MTERIVFRRLRLLAVVLASAGVAACGGGSTGDSSGGGTPAPAAPMISSFTATPSTIVPGGSATLAWTVTGGTSLTISPGLGTVTGASAVVTPTSTTTYTLTAAGAGGSATATATVTVSGIAVPVASVTVTLGSASLVVGQSTQATAVVRDASGNELFGRALTWASSDTRVATVDSSGRATSVSAGSASISASSEGTSGSAQLTVTSAVAPAPSPPPTPTPPPTPAPPAVASVSVTLSSSALLVGQTTQASAVTKDGGGNALTGRAVAWSTSGASVATVGASTGLVTAIGPGTASIIATSEGQSGLAVLTVAVDSFLVSGSVAGLLGTGLVLRTPGASDLPVAAGATTFAFPGAASGTAYSVSIAQQPVDPPQACSVANGAGTVGAANVTDVRVTCFVVGAQVAAGDRRALALLPDGSLWAWGLNEAGQLGDGTTTDRALPVQVPGTFARVAAGTQHNLAVKADGTLWAWGDNGSGQLGDGSGASHALPVQVGSQPGFEATGFAVVAAGSAHSAAIKGDGTLWAWGWNGYGQLGDGFTVDQPTPVWIGSGFAVVSAGETHTVAIKTDGTLWAWGWNGYGQLGDGTLTDQLIPVQIGTGFAAVAAGTYHTVALKTDGTLWTWGWNASGQLGDGTRVNVSTPVQVGSGYVAVAAGYAHSLALQGDGRLWSWGANNDGQVGDGSLADRLTPVLVGDRFAAVAAAYYNSVALRTDGWIVTWGENTFGQCGNGETGHQVAPRLIGQGFTAARARGYTSFAGRADGSLWGWGSNQSGIMGDGSGVERRLVPAQVGSGFASLAFGQMHGLGVKADGSLWAWGGNAYGQLGDGTTTSRSTPVQVGTGFASVGAGDYHSLAVKRDGTLWVWGANGYGQIGDGTQITRLAPVLVGTGYSKVAGGYRHSVAVKVDGSLWAWGYNVYGQLGDGSRIQRLAPVLVGTGFSAASAGTHTTYGVKTDGTLWAWGFGGWGQLGVGTMEIVTSSPVLVGTGIAAVAVGGYHTMALKSDGTLWGWGSNYFGNVGDGTRTARPSPVRVGSGFASVAAGSYHTVAAKIDGSLWAWGYNADGEVGIADGVDVLLPTPVLWTRPAPFTVSVTVTPGEVVAGQGAQASAVVRDASGLVVSGASVTWASSDPSVATVGAATGAVTAIAAGRARIVASRGGESGEATVTVSGPVASVVVTLAPASITTRQGAQASAVLRGADGFILTGRSVVWTSSNPSVATVDPSGGWITAVSVGTANIIATSEGRIGTALLSVPTVGVAYVEMTLPVTTLAVGQTTQGSAVMRDVSGNVLVGRAVTWQSSDTAVATVSVSGLVTAVGVGTAYITAWCENVGQMRAVQVVAPVSSVTVRIPSTSLAVHETTLALAEARDAGGNLLPVQGVAWQSSDPLVASVGAATGVVTGVAPGSATITATIGGASGTSTVTVRPQPVETCVLCHATGAATGTSNQNGFHDAAASNALHKGSISITGVSWSDDTTSALGDSVVPTVTFSLLDQAGNPVTPTLTAGGAWPSTSFRLGAAKYVVNTNAPGSYRYQSVVLSGSIPSTSSCSAAPACTAGECSCKFGSRKILKADWNPASAPATLEIGIEIASGFTVTNPATGVQVGYSANGTALLSGGAAFISGDRQVVTTAACNRCHGVLRVHLGRVDAQHCTVCHTSQMNTGGNPGAGNFSVMVHGLHAARQMGLNYSIAGVVGADITYPQDVRHCTTCHQGTQASFYKQMPGTEACLGCHVSTRFFPDAAGVNSAHQSGTVTTVSNCSPCHSAVGIDNSHAIPGVTATTPAASLVAADFSYTIQGVVNTAVGQFPVVTFKVNSPGSAQSNLKTSAYWTQTSTGNSRLAVVIGWSVGNYTNAGAAIAPIAGTINTNGQVVTLDALRDAVAIDAATGVFRVTSSVAIPSAATGGTILVGIEGHPAIPAASAYFPGTRIPVANAIKYCSAAAVPSCADTSPVSAANVVDLAACNACHQQLSAHGVNRQGSLELCAACHNTEATDYGRRGGAVGVDGMTQVPIDLKTMIHQIHAANIVVYGLGGAPSSFLGVTYPRPLANCQACHVASTSAYVAPPAAANGTTRALGLGADGAAGNLRTTPWFSVCGSCHVSGVSVDHMRAMGGG